MAEAAWEEIESGKKPEQVTPFWRLIEPGYNITQKLVVCQLLFDGFPIK
jgi:hypothetical protein